MRMLGRPCFELRRIRLDPVHWCARYGFAVTLRETHRWITERRGRLLVTCFERPGKNLTRKKHSTDRARPHAIADEWERELRFAA